VKKPVFRRSSHAFPSIAPVALDASEGAVASYTHVFARPIFLSSTKAG